MFVGEESDGRIYEITGGQARLWFDVAQAILAATGRHLDVRTNAHAGLRSVAFHPDFASNGKFYTSLMEERPSSTTGHHYLSDVVNPIAADSVLVEWTADPLTMAVRPGSYREVFRVGIPVYDHPIKQIMFRPESRRGDADYGLLYVAHGDGSFQSVTVGGGMANDARGKILRIDPLQQGAAPYGVPASNPFVPYGGMIPEAYSIGHRNPHHLAFARDGSLWVTEDGRDNVDEVNQIHPGWNYGWPAREGSYVHLAGGKLAQGISALPANDEAFSYAYPSMSYLHQGHDGDSFTGQALGGGYLVENGSPLSGRFFVIEFVYTGSVFFGEMAALQAAVTRGAPTDLRQAPMWRTRIDFDHDGLPSTPPTALGSMGEVSKLANEYAGYSRVDMRFGQGPRGELYLMSKVNQWIYLVTNSLP